MDDYNGMVVWRLASVQSKSLHCTFDATITIMYFWRCHYNHVLLTLSLQSCTSDASITIMYFWRYHTIMYFWRNHYNHVLLTLSLQSCTFDAIIIIMYFWRNHYNHVLLTLSLQSFTFEASKPPYGGLGLQAYTVARHVLTNVDTFMGVQTTSGTRPGPEGTHMQVGRP